MQWVILGQFGKTHGLKGWIKVHSFTEPKDNLLQYSEWYVKTQTGWDRLDLEAVQLQNRAVLVKITNVNDREQASLLTNHEIAVPEEALPPLKEGEYYWIHLIGMQVINVQGVLLGKVDNLLVTGSNDVLVVKGEKEHLIPYLPEQFIVTVDQEKNRIVVDWDENF